MTRHSKPFAFFISLLVFWGLDQELAAQSRDEARLLNRSEKIVNSIRKIQADESSKVPVSVMRQAKGIVLLKQYEAGVIFGAKGGFGIAVQRAENGDWGPPAWVKSAEISGGLQLGAQKLNVMLVILNEESLKILEKSQFRLGIDATVTRGPTGTNYEAKTGLDADILVYTDYQGYYAGATLDGSFLLPDRRSNEVTYGERLEVAEIIESQSLATPEFLTPIVSALKAIEQPDGAETEPPAMGELPQVVEPREKH